MFLRQLFAANRTRVLLGNHGPTLLCIALLSVCTTCSSERTRVGFVSDPKSWPAPLMELLRNLGVADSEGDIESTVKVFRVRHGAFDMDYDYMVQLPWQQTTLERLVDTYGLEERPNDGTLASAFRENLPRAWQPTDREDLAVVYATPGWFEGHLEGELYVIMANKSGDHMYVWLGYSF